MIPLILTILCSTSIALLLKDNDVKKGMPIVLLAGNYLIAALISLYFLIIDKHATVSVPTFLFGAALAFMFVYAFFLFTKAIAVAGAALASVSSRLSVVVPIVLSIVVFNEQPTPFQTGGFLLALVTIILFYFSVNNGRKQKIELSNYLYLLGLLLGIGLNDFCMKVFNQWRPASEKPFFLFAIFGCSFVYSYMYILIKNIKLQQNTFLRGGILGVPNIFSSYFLLAALAQLSAILVFPVINISIILLTTILAIIIWKERINKFGTLALIFGCLAIFLLVI